VLENPVDHVAQPATAIIVMKLSLPELLEFDARRTEWQFDDPQLALERPSFSALKRFDPPA
jgi:hypothetical protein